MSNGAITLTEDQIRAVEEATQNGSAVASTTGVSVKSTGEAQVDAELRRREERLAFVTDALPVLVAFVDVEQRYRFVSGAYERWFGRPKSQILGQHLEDVLGIPAYNTIRPYLERALSGETVTYEAVVPYQDGGTRCIEATYIPQRTEQGPVSGFVALVVDTTARKDLDRLAATAATRAERLLKITAAVADAVSAEQVYEAVVDQIGAAVDASSVALWLVDDDRRTATLKRAIGYSEAAKQRFNGISFDVFPSFPALDCIRRSEPIWIGSQEELLRAYPHLSSAVTVGRSYRVACLPLIAHGRTLGALGLSIEDGQEATPDERDFLLLVARYASQAVERLRLFDAERRSRAEADRAAARLGVLSQVSRAFVEGNLDLDSRLRGVVTEIGIALHSCVGVALLKSDGRLHMSAAYHPIREAEELLQTLGVAFPLQVGEGVTGSVAQSGESVLIPSIDPEQMMLRAAPSYRAFLERYPTYAMICAPLRAGGQIIGAVTGTRIEKGETYTHEDLRLFEELAERAAFAIENSRLYQETLDARFRAEQLYRFAQVVVTAERVEQVFEAALDAMGGALGTKRTAILLFDNDHVLRFRAFRELSDEYRRAVEGHSPWAPNAILPPPVLVPDVKTDVTLAQYHTLFRSEKIGALAFIPLITRGKLVGKFMAYFDEPHPYTSREVELASAIANHLASVTERFAAVARLEETIRHNELFAGVLAHDLRNPLAAILSSAQLLLMRQEGEGDKTAKPLGRILTSGQRMTRMIDQLLDFTRARAGGGIEIRPRSTNLADLCAQAVTELELAYPEWKVQREVHGDQSGSWDPDALLQIISNLVANAGQHGSADGAIRIKLDGRISDFVTLEIHNEGAIPEALLPALFDPFRGTRHRRDQSRGLGLGLFVVREMVRAHGGRVDVTSSDAFGTRFEVRLPRYRPIAAS